MDLGDVDQITGAIQIRQGKGHKPRTVFLGKTSRKVLRNYLKHRKGDGPALFVTRSGDRLAYVGLRGVVQRRGEMARVQPPTLHSFRRAFALSMLRNGANIYSLQNLMGHADLSILRRYLKQTDGDLAQAHMMAGPVDHL
jgi:integrase/recombinase XerD